MRPIPFRSAMCAAMSLGLALGLVSCSEKPPIAGDSSGAGKKTGKSGKGGGGPAPVIVGKVQRKRVPLVIEAIGALEPIRTAAIRSQITGVLQHIAIREGQEVKEGDLLFEIDPRPYRNALQTAEADRQRTRVQLEYAQHQVTRYRVLSTDQMVSKEQFQKMQDDARALEAQAQSADAALANAKLQLEYCSIRAPLSGRTGNIMVHEGDLVRSTANDTAFLVTIHQLTPIYATFGVPQQYLAAINRHETEGRLEVRAVPPGTDEAAEIGELTFIDNTVDPATGTIKLKGTFPNGSRRLWPGQFCQVALTLSAPEVLTIASSAVQTAQTGQHVFVVKPDKIAELRPIVVERSSESDAVVSKGLAEGETVVIDGQLRVVPNKPVDIKEATGTPVAGATPSAPGDGKRKKKKET